MQQNSKNTLSATAVAALIPNGLAEKLALVQREFGGKVYLVGGSVRELTGGTLVELGREEDAARIVLRQGLDVDFSSFRVGARSIVLPRIWRGGILP